MADKKSINLLPEFLRTDKNAKFLSSAFDPLIQTPQLERIDGYIGSKITPTFNPKTDFYLDEVSYLRKSYPLEPALVLKNSTSEITDVISYDDLINEIGVQGGKNKNLDRLFRSTFYSYDPLIDWDKLVNYPEYYWLPNGPDPILIKVEGLDLENSSETMIGKTSYTLPSGHKLSNGMKITFLNDVVPASYRDKTFIVEGVGSSITLVDFTLLEAQESLSRVYNEVFDGDIFDEYPFDGDQRLPLDPEYVTINKASKDLNPWTRYNRWFHGEIIRLTAEINGDAPVYPLAFKAKRPIIEFKPNLQLYNFGKTGIRNVDLLDTDTRDAFKSVEGTFGYYVDGVLLEEGNRVIFNADSDANVRGKIYEVRYDLTAPTPILHLEEADDFTPDDFDSISVNYGLVNSGKTFYYNALTNKWIEAQQRTLLNETPLFDLFDSDGVSYTQIADKNNFVGNKIFGYDVGTGTPDPILNFPLKYQNSVGVGSYLFKNYFMTDVISITSNAVSNLVSTGIAYIKINNSNSYTLLNVWNNNVQDYKIPITEVQTVNSTTSTLSISSLNTPISYPLTVTAFVNGSKQNVSINTGSNVVTFSTPLAANDTVLLKIITDQLPNENGAYEVPISLTNNPLNGPISDLTLSELSDHVFTMVSKITGFEGKFPGTSNLRDLSDYSKYGTRLLINSNPIAFSQFFLGKKEHNVVDAIRFGGEQYNQFKLNLINYSKKIDGQLLPKDALDEILREFGKNKNLESPYYRSDMLGFGPNKIVRSYTVSNPDIVEYATSLDFKYTELSFRSVLIYVNNVQLVLNRDYTVDPINETVTFLVTLFDNDTIDIVHYLDTRGCYIPPTPSKLGLYPTFVPEIFEDNSYVDSPIKFIRGHDGSLTKAFNDYRDNIILEFEKRVFNNIKVEYNNNIFDVMSIMPGAFRTTEYNLDEVNDLIVRDFMKWCGAYGVDAFTNNTFDDTDSFTWNYKNTIDLVFDKKVPGHWRGIYKYFFDTDAPNLRPWEMLGLGKMPDWWESKYGVAPYTSSNTWLWQDLEEGFLWNVDSPRVTKQGITLIRYARPGLSSIIPVNATGELKSPAIFLTTQSTYFDKSSKWKFGDISPAESAWRKSSWYPFAVNAMCALLEPCNYISKMYDLSRSNINSLGQITYFEDDLYLNLKKLVIDGDDGNQTAGYSVFLVEKGQRKNQNYIEILKQDLSYLDFNLFHKLGGFASKEKLQINIDSVDPVSRSPGVVLPPEDYNLILNISNPIKAVSISGIIVQKSNGKFIVKGYNVAEPYFEILNPIKSATSGALTVGGKSETFTEWSGFNSSSTTSRYYKQGQIVRYGDKFYRVKVSHTAQSTFDPTLFQQLSSLPLKGGVSVKLASKFETSSTIVPYGTELSNPQEVFDFIIGYGAWLESQGFVFDQYNIDLNEIINWRFSGKEFLYWTTQNWSNNNVITLSPFSDYLKFQSNISVVDNLINENYDYKLLTANGSLFPIDKFNLTREDGYCLLKTVDTQDGVFFANLRLVQKEHAFIFNNSTIFNDTIYDIETGYKQARVKLSGFRTKQWNGDFFSPGFIYDNVSVTDWQEYKSYLPGQVVRYNSNYYQANEKILNSKNFEFSKWSKLPEKPIPDLIPNFDYKINQFEDFYSLDIDNFDYGQQQLAQHLVGYTPREYLNNIFFNPISQYKFYQGFIKEKGTRSAFDKLTKATLFNNQGDVNFNEEWAFRVGHYGSFSTYNELEFSLTEGSYLENPYIVKFVDTLPSVTNPLVHYTSATNFLLTPDNYISSQTFVTYPGTFNENNIELLTAGYARLDDVTATAFNKNSLLDIANNDQIAENSTIWLGFLENGDWTIYRYAQQRAKITGVYVKSPGSEIAFVTDKEHQLSKGDIVSVVRFNGQVDGVHIVKEVVSLKQFSVASTLSTIVDEDLINPGTLFKFELARFNNVSSLANKKLFSLNDGDLIWLDRDIDDKWKVFKKVDNYSTKTYESVDVYGGQQLGYTIHTTENSPILLAAAPGQWVLGEDTYGKVLVYQKTASGLEKRFDYFLETDYHASNTATQFGYSLAYDEGKKLYFASAPAASKIKASLTTGTVVSSTGTETSKLFDSEGVVKISSPSVNFDYENTEFVLVSPFATTTATAQNSRFGNSIYINQVSNTEDTLLLVSAPGDAEFNGTGAVYAYQITTVTNTLTNLTTIFVSRHPNGITVENTSTVTFSAKSRIGTKIVGDRVGNNIAISAPGFNSTVTSKIGVVQIYDNNLACKQTLASPYNNKEVYGDDIFMSSSGKYLLVSSVNEKVGYQTYGKVYVYQLSSDNNKYYRIQILENPIPESDLKFGYSLSISDDDTTITVSALGTNRSQVVNFDTNTGTQNLTTFDGNTTKIINDIPDAGTVYVYTKIGNYFIPVTELYDTLILSGSKYGHDVLATNNSIYIGAPSSTGVGIGSLSLTTPVEVGISETLTVDIDSPANSNGVEPTVTINYFEISTSTKSVVSITITNPGSGYRYIPNAYLKNGSGAVLNVLTVALEPDDSKIYQFNKIDSSINGYKVLRQQEDLVDVAKVKKIALIDSFKEEIIDYLDVIDPLKGKIAGIAEQELKYKTAFDPAIYSIGTSGTVNDKNVNWLDDHIGELWWDLSNAKYVWYEQGDEVYKKNNWGKLFPGSSIDVYEWVKTDLLPSEWAAQADTNDGLSKGVSGQPKYPNNSVISVKQVYNTVTGVFENVYYYWVKNKTILPNVKNRRISAFEVSSIIADPIAAGLKFAEVLSNDAIAFANIQPSLISNRINVNVAVDVLDNQIPRHTEWLLLEEGNPKSVPTTLLEKKLIDSLLGHDPDGRVVPAANLSYRNRYGLGIRPQQTLFKDRIEALRNIVEFSNSILEKNIITGKYSFENLNKEEQIPTEESGEYDLIFEDFVELDALDTTSYVRAELQCFISNGQIRNVTVINPGYGYTFSPEIYINGSLSSGAKLIADIDNEGRILRVNVSIPGSNFTSAPILTVRPHTIIISNDPTAGNKWTKNIFNYESRTWVKLKTQSYNTPLYWEYIDWKKSTFDQYKGIRYLVNDPLEVSKISNISAGDYVKIKNFGDGRFVILEKLPTGQLGDFSTDYNIVYSENGTLRIKDTLWNFKLTRYTYDDLTLEESLYDQTPDLEIFYIITALKENIFVNELKVNWNLLFFTAVKYALTEQKLLDWAFKTSFISVQSSFGNLDQRPVYKLDNDEYFEKYIDEVKPYRTKVRNYTSKYATFDQYGGEETNSDITDFDLPPYYNSLTDSTILVGLNNPLINQYPWKWWADNYKYKLEEILVSNPGSGYTQRPVVTITTATGDTGSGASAEAYIRNGEIYQILVTNQGSGYTIAPIITITGGGNVVTTATVSAVIGDNPIRKNKVGIKFDRVGPINEVGNESFTETFLCDGETTDFELTWLADPRKEYIVPQLDGKIVFATDYTIEYYTREFNRYKKKFAKFVFLNYVPAIGQEFKITYKKNVNLYTAVDRINSFYTPEESMIGKDNSLLMTGFEYPNTIIQGLPLGHAISWNPPGNKFGSFVWDELVEYYSTAKLVSTATLGTTTLVLNTTTGIVPGQVINVLNSSTVRLRTDTVVVAVSGTSITISNLAYPIKSAKAVSTASGSIINIRTKTNFYGNLKIGDTVLISGINTPGYNGKFIVNQIDENNYFQVLSTGTLAYTTSSISASATVQVPGILDTILSDNVVLDYIVNTSTNVTATIISAFSPLVDVVRSSVTVNGTPITNYSIVEDLEVEGKSAVNVYGLNSSTTNTIRITLYGNPTVEFWKYNTLASALDTSISGGSWSGTNFVGALGVAPEDINILGESFYSYNNNYGPEELVPGHILDSVGINVYTRSETARALVFTGAFAVNAGTTTTASLSLIPQASAGMLVSFNGKIFNRSTTTNFTTSNQYFIEGNMITIPPQITGGRAGYTVINSGGREVLDSNVVVVSGQTEALVQSVASADDVKRAYVLVNGEEIYEVTTTSSYGYILDNVSSGNNRACVKVYNLSPGTNTIEAWFFATKLEYFNRVHEEIFVVPGSQSTFTLSIPPANIEPVVAATIVEAGNPSTSTDRRRLLPPNVTYYQVANGQTTYAIDNENNRPPGYYSLGDIRIYVNGGSVPLRPGFDYVVNGDNSITLATNLLSDGDAMAIMTLKDYEYFVSGNVLTLTSPLVNGSLRVLTFTNHDSLLMHTEKFDANNLNRYTLTRPAYNDNYVWVYLNGLPLIPRYDFEILEDFVTIQFSEFIDSKVGDKVIITTVAEPAFETQLLGYRIFKDILDRYEYKRLAEYHTTFLTRDLKLGDTEIYVQNDNKLIPPNPAQNKPGVILVDGERIEFFKKEGNVLSQLRRSTLGTGPAFYSQPGTSVIDLSIQQTIPYVESTFIQRLLTTNSTTYAISTITSTSTGDGIVITPGIRAADQLTVYYGGRQLRKNAVSIHDINLAYDTTNDSLNVVAPEFTINTATQLLTLNISESITTGTQITIVQKKGYVWTGSESLLMSSVPQAEFIRRKQAKLPDVYYYGGDPTLLYDSYFPLTNENDDPLEEY